jgi:hypothetical protein
MPRAIPGFGGSLTLGGTTLYAKDITITRQAAEYDITALGDAKMLSGPGRVKRGGSATVYVGGSANAIVAAIETPTLATPASLVFTDANGTATTLAVIITGADQQYDGQGAATWSISFTETVALTP